MLTEWSPGCDTRIGRRGRARPARRPTLSARYSGDDVRRRPLLPQQVASSDVTSAALPRAPSSRCASSSARSPWPSPPSSCRTSSSPATIASSRGSSSAPSSGSSSPSSSRSLQLLLLPLIFVSYGLVVVLINTVVLLAPRLDLPGPFPGGAPPLGPRRRARQRHARSACCENLFGLDAADRRGQAPRRSRRRSRRPSTDCVEKELLAVTAGTSRASSATTPGRTRSGRRRRRHEALVARQVPRGPAPAAGLQHAPALRHGRRARAHVGLRRRLPPRHADLGLASAQGLGGAAAPPSSCA